MEQEIQIWEKLAELDVIEAKKMKELQNLFLLTMVNSVSDIFSKENPYVLPQSDIRYRTYVIKILSECKRQELPDYENLLVSVVFGKYSLIK